MASMLRLFLAWVCITLTFVESAASLPAPVDSASVSLPPVAVPVSNPSSFHPAGLIVPGALIAVGAVGASSRWFRREIDRPVTRALGSSRQWRAADYLQFLPLAASFALPFAGLDTGYDTADRLVAAATSFVILEAVTQPLKRVACRWRPDLSDDHSFPSGHTATAFAGAERCRIYYGNWAGLAAYSVATGVAVLRIAGRHHWLSDCIAGAGIGILSARAAMWLLPLERRILHHIPLVNRISPTRFAAIPALTPSSASLSLVALF